MEEDDENGRDDACDYHHRQTDPCPLSGGDWSRSTLADGYRHDVRTRAYWRGVATESSTHSQSPEQWLYVDIRVGLADAHYHGNHRSREGYVIDYCAGNGRDPDYGYRQHHLIAAEVIVNPVGEIR